MDMVVCNISGLGAILPFTICAAPLSRFNFDRFTPQFSSCKCPCLSLALEFCAPVGSNTRWNIDGEDNIAGYPVTLRSTRCYVRQQEIPDAASGKNHVLIAGVQNKLLRCLTLDIKTRHA